MDHQRPSSRLDFEVAIICALPLEFDAIALLFDHLWDEDGDQYGRAVGDPNHYTTGRFGKYNIVLALLTHTDRATAASTAASMRTSYPRLRLALFVGICSGVPHIVSGDDEYELMLGDVVISNTVVQYDFVVQHPGNFVHKDTVESNSIRPNKDIRNLLATFQTDFCMDRLRKKTINYLRKLQASAPVKTRGKYRHPGTLEDKLFEPTYLHKHQASAACCGGSEQTSIYICEKAICSSCEDLGCDEKYLVARHQPATNRLSSQIGGEEPFIHIGAVASGDTAMKSGGDRDHIAKNEGIIAFDMGGAGVWEEVPCIIVKGVCDYADSHQNKKWQVFAAATAASASKAILERYIQTEREIVTFHSSGKSWHAIPDQMSAYSSLPERDTGLLSTFQLKIRQLEIMLAKSKGKNQILQSSVTQLRTEIRIILQSHLQVPRSMTIDYIMVIDALNRPLRFFLETIRSKKLFIEILKEAFDGIGSKKIEKEDWFLEDGDNGQVLDLNRPWMSLMKPGRILHMGMIFHRRGTASTQCPICHAENAGDPTEQVTCSCGLTYCRIEEFKEVGLVGETTEPFQTRRNDFSSEGVNVPKAQPTKVPPLKRPRPPTSDDNDDDDDITRYKRIQVINTDFLFKVMEGSKSNVIHVIVGLQDLQDLESFASFLSKTFSVPEDDCLAALNDCKPQVLATTNLHIGLDFGKNMENPADIRPPTAQQKTFEDYPPIDWGSAFPAVDEYIDRIWPERLRNPVDMALNALNDLEMGGSDAIQQGGPASHQAAADTGNSALQDYEMQHMLLERQNKKRLRMPRQEQNDIGVPGAIQQGGPASHRAAAGTSNHALQDYQMQIMLLEQQNKKRLMMARQEQDDLGVPGAIQQGGSAVAGSKNNAFTC